MTRFARWTTLAGLLGSLMLGAAAMADEESIPVKQLPSAVRKAAKAKFPKAKIEEAAKEVEDGETIYEVTLKVKGHAVDVAMKADGTILEIEKEVSLDQLPKAVKKALASKYPNAKISKVEEITKGEDGPVLYEVVLASEVVLNAKGKSVKSDDEKANAKSSKKDDDEDEDDDDDDKDSRHAKVKGKKQVEREDREEDDDDDDDDHDKD